MLRRQSKSVQPRQIRNQSDASRPSGQGSKCISFYSNEQALIQLHFDLLSQGSNNTTTHHLNLAVPETLIPDSVLALSKRHLNDLEPVSLDVRSDLFKQRENWNSNNLMQQWLGHQVKVTQAHSGRDSAATTTGKLLYIMDPSTVVLQQKSSNHQIIVRDVISIEGLRDNTNNNPHIQHHREVETFERTPNFLEINNTNIAAGDLLRRRFLDVSYVADGFRWNSSYKLVLNPTGNMIITGQAEAIVFNDTNFALERYQPKFVIGSPRRAYKPPPSASAYSQEQSLTSVDHSRKTSRAAIAMAVSPSMSMPTQQSEDAQFFVLNGSRKITLHPYSQVQYLLTRFHNQRVRPIFTYVLESVNFARQEFQKAQWGIEIKSASQALPPGQVVLYQIRSDDLHIKSETESSANTFPIYLGASSIDRAVPPYQKCFLEIGDTEHVVGIHRMRRTDRGESQLQPGYEIQYDIVVKIDIGRQMPADAIFVIFMPGYTEAQMIGSQIKASDGVVVEQPKRDFQNQGWKWNVAKFPIGGSMKIAMRFILTTRPEQANQEDNKDNHDDNDLKNIYLPENFQQVKMSAFSSI